ncbi:MAG TPA: LLM class F420-dependent oxidoreductase [Chloroflexota bacterium]|nr:LLM class F420-dependent oxidoreductase [Chloroflexota bacterium]
MQIGVVFPQTEIGADPGGVRAYTQAIQQLGFAHLIVYDHVVGADPASYPGWSGPYTVETMFHEPFVLFGYLAAMAPGLELVTGVIILPQRQAVLVAKQAAEVDVLTAGKLRLGVGIGWNAVEYEALGTDFHNRGRRFEEQIEVMRRLWTEPVVSFEGRYHRVVAAGLNPLPIQRPIPVWIGGSSEPALKRAAAVADGFFPQRPLEGGWPATLEKLRGWRKAAGRDPASLGIEARLNATSGTPDDWRAVVEEWRSLGATHLAVNTMGAGLQTPDAHVQRLQQVLQVVRP